jgi:PKD repeat protein
VADAGADVTVLQGDPVAFNASGSTDNVGIVSYRWSFRYAGEDVLLEGRAPEYTFLMGGTYQVTLTISDWTGNEATDVVTVNVRDVTLPVAVAGEDREMDQHVTHQFDGSESSDETGIVVWDWSFVYNGSRVVLEGPEPTFTFDEAGTYEVTLTVEDAAGNMASDVVTMTVRDITPPVPVPGPSKTVDQGATVVLDGSGSWDNVGIVSYEWTITVSGSPVFLAGAVNEQT